MKEKFEQRVKDDFKDAAERGPSQFPASSDWTQTLLQKWCPPQCRIHFDTFNGRWRTSWRFGGGGTCSRSFALWGVQKSGLLVLQAAWTAFEHCRCVACPIPGIIDRATAPLAKAAPAAPAAPALAKAAPGAPPAAPKPKAKPKAKGAAKAKLMPKAAAPPPGAPGPVAAPAPGAPAPDGDSSSSDGSAGCENSDSSSDSSSSSSS